MGYGYGTMDGLGRCMKLSLVVVNIITFIGGIIAFAIGLWVLIDRMFANQLITNNIFLASVCVIVGTGAAIMLVSFLGCCGAAKEVKCMLITYFIIVLIIFVMMLIGGILIYVFREKIRTSLERQMHASISYYGNREEYTISWDDTQTLLQCCGVNSYRDWTPGEIPSSCCREVFPGRRVDCRVPDPTTIYMDGCLDKVKDFFRHDAIIVGTVAIVVACLMIFSLIFSCGVFMKIE